MQSSSVQTLLQRLLAFAKKPTGMLVVALILLGCFLRFYRLPSTIHFQGDQGRDAILVKRMITEGNLPFIGPVTSVGNLYLGPFYYYYMAPWLALSYPSPIGPVVGVALANVLSLVVLYLLTNAMFGQKAAIFSLAIYAVMVPAVAHSRFSWNPNIMPLVMLAIMYCLHMSRKHAKYLAFAWLLFGLIIQLHYMALLLGGVIAGYSLFLFVENAKQRKQLMIWSLLGIGLFGLTLVPQIAFDLKNRGILSQGFIRFFTGDEIHLSASSQRLSLATKLLDRLAFLLLWLLRIPQQFSSLAIFAVLFVSWAYGAISKKIPLPSFLLIALTLAITWIGSYLYTSEVHEHYVAFFFPVAAIIWGTALASWSTFHGVGKVAGVVVVGLLMFVNISQAHPLRAESKPLSRFARVVDLVAPFLEPNQKYNLAMVADDREYKALNYRYFFEVSDNPPAHEDDYANLDQLVVIAETKDIDPTTLSPIEFHPLHEMTLVKRIPQTDGPDILIYSR